MNQTTANEADLAGFLSLLTYLDNSVLMAEENCNVNELLNQVEKYISERRDDINANPKDKKQYEKIIDEIEAAKNTCRDLLEVHSDWGELRIVDRSNIDDFGTNDNWKDDYIQAFTFVNENTGDYYISFRGTGDARWVDNGSAMAKQSSEMQMTAADYFDYIAEKFLLKRVNPNGKVIVTGHSKGGNEAQYVNIFARYEYLIDNVYSFDGQGDSPEAIAGIERRREIYGDDYVDEQLNRMYSINGDNDFVHGLGLQIIPEENTYYVDIYRRKIESFGDLFPSLVGDLHNLNAILGKKTVDGEEIVGFHYNGGVDENGNIRNGEEGLVGKYTRYLTTELMAMNPTDRENCAEGIMFVVNLMLANDKRLVIGHEKIDPLAVIDLLADAVPSMFCAGLGLTIEETVENASLNFEQGSFVKGALHLFLGSAIFTGLTVAGVAYFEHTWIIQVVDLCIDALRELKHALVELKNKVVELWNNLIEAIRCHSDGYKSATANPHLIVNTDLLESCANTLDGINRRLITVDMRMDSLYWSVGWRDLLALLEADLITSYSIRLKICESYLRNTSNEFKNIENELKQMQLV